MILYAITVDTLWLIEDTIAHAMSKYIMVETNLVRSEYEWVKTHWIENKLVFDVVQFPGMGVTFIFDEIPTQPIFSHIKAMSEMYMFAHKLGPIKSQYTWQSNTRI